MHFKVCKRGHLMFCFGFIHELLMTFIFFQVRWSLSVLNPGKTFKDQTLVEFLHGDPDVF